MAGGLSQSLGQGAAGIALLHVECAAVGIGTWGQAHAWIRAAVADSITTAPEAGLYAGAPAVAFLLSCAVNAGADRYTNGLEMLLGHVASTAHQRLNAAIERVHAQTRAEGFAEYDLISGLTGIGALLLHAQPDDSLLLRILEYLVALTRPVESDGRRLPGWWVDQDPDPTLPTPGGHANNGVAHGIAGPLALLATTYRRGNLVDGHTDAIARIVAHLKDIRQATPTGSCWPQWQASTTPDQTALPRPSWCYGTPGIARALQLAALATKDTDLQTEAETALVDCLTNPAFTSTLAGQGLCHGWGGTHLTTWHAARDSTSGDLRAILPDVLGRFIAAQTGDKPGFLDGSAGSALAALHALTNAPTTTGWESCLLIT